MHYRNGREAKSIDWMRQSIFEHLDMSGTDLTKIIATVIHDGHIKPEELPRWFGGAK